jgi:hypothetical protein
MPEDDELTERGKQVVRLLLDTDAAVLLPKLAGSPRKQGEYVSRLIRDAAERTGIIEVEQADLPTLRRLVMGLMREVDELKRRST